MTPMNDISSDFLYARPSFWEGASRMLDISRALDEYNVSASPQEADARALAADWRVLGDDLRAVLKRHIAAQEGSAR